MSSTCFDVHLQEDGCVYS